MERSETRDCLRGKTIPDYASLHPGYKTKTAARSGGRFYFNSDADHA
jgi:hypothetical protein